MKKIRIGGMYCAMFFYALVSHAASCPRASSLSSATFCETFKQAGACNCMSNFLPEKKCADMNFVYRMAVGTLGNLQRVCEHQHITSVTECIDGWNCYRYGGFSSDGQLCSGTGRACE